MGWGDFIKKERSEEKVMSLCKKGTICRVLFTIANTCATAARPENATDSDHWIIATDPNPTKSKDKAVGLCEAKYGKDKCVFSFNESTPSYGNTYFSGYNYEAYNQE